MQAMDFVTAAKAERDALALTYGTANAGSSVRGFSIDLASRQCPLSTHL